jgi:hypothetical protein
MQRRGTLMNTKILMNPQPKVRKIDCGWDINGANYFMGFSETHIKSDSRFKPPYENYTDFYVVKEDGLYYWVFTHDKELACVLNWSI